ncbi:Oxidoreductase [Colletotrichum higginsianum IMI 349063]|uniref:Oxidoreductase n=1 Tax=Colletotrichum higginsianum (strain IMI 349063) TaxID=759273 RepID=A0A1B7XR36_COLHI|nr:Oxidoreductase [Colletotrichum higginsianum IMI 349063]OBR02228.1 Oxidoreductase [Colletotrichum higginsianum IMI 349063]
MSSPIPFPNGLPMIDLPRVSLSNLLRHDEKELDKLFDICLSTSFFYLNLQDCPKGEQLWNQAVKVCNLGKATLPVLDIETKLSYKSRETTGVFDLGYKCPSISKNSEPKFSKAFNKNEVCHVMLRTLETQLQLEPGALMSLHRREDPSYNFLRVLQYPATAPGDNPNAAKFPPHRNSCWVEPVNSHVIVNISDALAVLTNEVLHSGFHRVIGAPGDQAKLDKYSVLLGYRPVLNTPMKPFTSPLIPQLSEEQSSDPVQTYQE